MSQIITAKADYIKIPGFLKRNLETFEMYITEINSAFKEGIKQIPTNVNILAVHSPSVVDVNGTKYPMNLVDQGEIGNSSLRALQELVQICREQKIKKIVIHCALYDIQTQTKEQAIKLLCERCANLFGQGVELMFETDALWFTRYNHSRSLLATIEDFNLLNRELTINDHKMKVVADIEHLSFTYHMKEFIQSIGGEKIFLEKYPENNKGLFDSDSQQFIQNNYSKLQIGLKKFLMDFFHIFHQQIEHIHLNGTDPKNYCFDASKINGLPLHGEHLPINHQKGDINDRLDYCFLQSLFKTLPKEKQIPIVLEISRPTDKEQLKAAHDSNRFIKKYIKEKKDENKGEEKMTKKVKLGDVEVHNFSKPFVIAEIGSNHNGNLDLAKKLIDEAVDCGVDAVKFQAYDMGIFANSCYEDDPRRPVLMEKSEALRKYFGSVHPKLRKEMQEYMTSMQMFRDIKRYCDEKGVMFFCSSFDKKFTDFCVDELDMPIVKIASMDLNNLPFVDYMARKGKPILLSTGMGTIDEIIAAVNTIKAAGNEDIVILHCVSIYPPRNDIVNLNNIDTLQKLFPYPIGFSDHTFGTAIPLASVAKGACVIEKHFTFDKNYPGWDHKISATPEEMKVIVEDGRKIQECLGSTERVVTQDEQDKRVMFRRSIVVTKDLNFTKTTSGDILYVAVTTDATTETYTEITPSGTETWTEITPSGTETWTEIIQ